jgi:hypothetical protein
MESEGDDIFLLRVLPTGKCEIEKWGTEKE